MNKIILNKGELNVDITVQGDDAVVTILKMLLELDAVTKVVKPSKKNKYKTPPIWIVECEGCNDFITINRPKIQGNEFKCNKCEGSIQLEGNDLVVTNYTCECGTPHNTTVQTLSKVVNTKCRKCSTPIDLKWNEEKETYYKL